VKTFFSLCPYRGCVGERVELLTKIFKVIEEEHPNHPEEDQGDEDHYDQATVHGAVHLEIKLS
jgi:hypothetical protein